MRRLVLQVCAIAACFGAVSASAQIDASDERRLVCRNLQAPKRVIAQPSIAPAMEREACRALALSVEAIGKKYAGMAPDSLIVTRHDFPTLGTKKSESMYQVGAFLHGGPYVECIVDRRSWKARVQFQEGR